jgi:hypothetical protein
VIFVWWIAKQPVNPKTAGKCSQEIKHLEPHNL